MSTKQQRFLDSPSLTDVGLGGNVGEGVMNLRTEADGRLESILECTTLSGLDQNRECKGVHHLSTMKRMDNAKTSTDSIAGRNRKAKN